VAQKSHVKGVIAQRLPPLDQLLPWFLDPLSTFRISIRNMTATTQVTEDLAKAKASDMGIDEETDRRASDTTDYGEDASGDGSSSSSPVSEDENEDEVEWDSESDSWSDDEYPPLELDYDALEHVARYFVPGHHGRCIKISVIGRGCYHELRRLRFADGWICIARFNCDRLENHAVTESGYATMEYVREHTTIPVPRIYFTNLDPTNPVGAPFALMEHVPGHSLLRIWKCLSIDQRLAVVKQIADIISQLAELRFGSIGSITGRGIGPLQNKSSGTQELVRGPFHSIKDYLMAFLQDGTAPEMIEVNSSIRAELSLVTWTHSSSPACMPHTDSFTATSTYRTSCSLGRVHGCRRSFPASPTRTTAMLARSITPANIQSLY
jgi:hypothetical protein